MEMTQLFKIGVRFAIMHLCKEKLRTPAAWLTFIFLTCALVLQVLAIVSRNVISRRTLA